jgi:hypothetical protein
MGPGKIEGTTSLIDVVLATSMDTGKVMEVEMLTKYLPVA